MGMIKYKCSCCGGNINRATMICEYCGTRYKEEYGNVMRIETFRNPVHTIKTQLAIDDYALRLSPKEYSEFAIRELVNQFAECIAPYMDIHYSHEYITGIAALEAQIKIVQPSHKASDMLDEILSSKD